MHRDDDHQILLYQATKMLWTMLFINFGITTMLGKGTRIFLSWEQGHLKADVLIALVTFHQFVDQLITVSCNNI
ncbi:hypothetical protein AMTR_s00045p00091680 [Amborella trichopoda]|uniref:Uncharacterized protein n=1 Tax=Amborella trichopoda TaxID=13333 RepID=W1P4W5_AMBTC|nr:hypothetical protein AMTR_s00045p00091680 [Amborella trichopoda]